MDSFISGGKFAEGQFSDADEDSDSCRRDCRNLPLVNSVCQEEKLNWGEFANNEDRKKYESYNLINKKKRVSERDIYSSVTCDAKKSVKVEKYQPSSKLMKNYEGKIHLGKYEGLSANVTNKVDGKERKEYADRYRVRDKTERATVEQVLDPKTRLILFKLLSKKIVTKINGCISTGKEANVYHAVGHDIVNPGEKHAKAEIVAELSERSYAVKIYKTSILVFKDRDKYVSGDFKFRHGYGKKNPRKMVQTWAEKEMSNLCKLHSEGLPVPKPIILRSHVLVMDYLGTDSMPAPRLKDANISESKARELYMDLVNYMWIMYRKCKLVHADLSEFNLLYHNGKAFIIDVSQSVTPDHPHSLEFLRKDCSNITDFFRKKGVPTMTLKELFEYIVDPTVTEDNREERLNVLREVASQRDPFNLSPEEKFEEELFKNIYIPKTFDQVIDFERDMSLLHVGERTVEDIHYRTILGLKDDLTGAKSEIVVESEKDEEGYESDCSEDDGSEDSKSKGERRPLGRPKDETLEEKKRRKQLVKDAQAEKRKTKMKKHEKKLKLKRSSKDKR
ncbi:Serine/threonine-protein kinase RIO1 [Armadillidium nasatum]|uniref:Serine/threonine-protein kinase RIO1 n=1 Tax=Armadillidium nasatum TaxID=96803 RepID=A0A5N5SMN9_9CRUS|nr:Serine/threonine-protein kinase RIO1 [Armadillidium nasatum]